MRVLPGIMYAKAMSMDKVFRCVGTNSLCKVRAQSEANRNSLSALVGLAKAKVRTLHPQVMG